MKENLDKQRVELESRKKLSEAGGKQPGTPEKPVIRRLGLRMG